MILCLYRKISLSLQKLLINTYTVCNLRSVFCEILKYLRLEQSRGNNIEPIVETTDEGTCFLSNLLLRILCTFILDLF